MNKRIEQLPEYLKNINLLYLDDDIEEQEDTLEFFSSLFTNIFISNNGKDGLQIFQDNQIDIIITSLNMPKLNGIEMLEKIRLIDKDCHIIVILQGNESETLLRCIKLNIDSFILKPLDFEQLLISIEKSMEKFKFSYESQNHKNYLEQYLALIDKNNIISKTDLEGNITYANESFCKISGYKKNELIGRKHSITRHHESTKEKYKDLWNTIEVKKEIWEGVIRNKSKSGTSYFVRTVITPIKNTEGDIVEYIAVQDNLNGIINDKQFLFEEIEENELSILILLQIDEFDMLEKFYNIVTVDKMGKTFALNLLSFLPESYTFENVYSLSNGRFALLTDFNKFEKSKLNIKHYINDFVENVKTSHLEFDNMEFDFNITVSYATGKFMLYEDANDGLDKALLATKKITFSNDSSIIASKEAKDNLAMIKTVKIALDNYNIVSYFQPIINNKTKEIEKYESLVRLIDENGNILSPFHFLDVSKKGNHYNKITQRVLENSFKILHTINTKLSINISSVDIEKEQTRLLIFDLLEKYKEDAHRIVFELLEDESVQNFKVIKNFILKVKKIGVQIAIDDFGAGYSSFERVLEFDPDIVKIDGSLIKNIETDNFSRNIVEAIVLFAKKQNIQTIAEFVENEAIFNILNEIGVDYSQGYYFGKPEAL